MRLLKKIRPYEKKYPSYLGEKIKTWIADFISETIAVNSNFTSKGNHSKKKRKMHPLSSDWSPDFIGM